MSTTSGANRKAAPSGTNADIEKVGGHKLSTLEIEAIVLNIPGFVLPDVEITKAHFEDLDPDYFTDPDSNVAEPDSQSNEIVTDKFQTFYESNICDNGAFKYVKNFWVRKGVWESLVCWDEPNHSGYLDDRHIETYLSYLHTKFGDEYKWSGSSVFIPLLRRDDCRRFKCADGSWYPNEWKRCKKLLWPIHDEPKKHWYLAVFCIRTGKISFYDSCLGLGIQTTKNFKHMRVMLSEKIPPVLHEIGWFESNGVDGNDYEITFDCPPNVPQASRRVFTGIVVLICYLL